MGTRLGWWPRKTWVTRSRPRRWSPHPPSPARRWRQGRAGPGAAAGDNPDALLLLLLQHPLPHLQAGWTQRCRTKPPWSSPPLHGWSSASRWRPAKTAGSRTPDPLTSALGPAASTLRTTERGRRSHPPLPSAGALPSPLGGWSSRSWHS